MEKKEKKYIAPNEASLFRWILALVVGFVIGVVIAIAVTVLLRKLPGSIMGVGYEQIYTLCQFVCYFAGAVIGLKLVAKTSLKDFVLGAGSKVNMKECLLILGLYLVGYALLYSLGIGSIRLRGVNAGEFLFLVVFMLLTVWTQTTWEEFIFRGYLLRWACKNKIGFNKKSAIIAIVTSAAFALGHVSNPEVTSQSGFGVVLAVATYAIPGLVYFLADLHFGSLLPGILIHWINNFLTFTLIGSDSNAMPLPTLLVIGSGGDSTVVSLFLGNFLQYAPIIVYILWDIWKKKKAASVG